jgi:hypothetical protein
MFKNNLLPNACKTKVKSKDEEVSYSLLSIIETIQDTRENS